MNKDLEDKLRKAVENFWKEVYSSGEVNESQFAQLLLGMAYNRCRATGASLEQIIAIIKKASS
jgi:hypothetical protein